MFKKKKKKDTQEQNGIDYTFHWNIYVCKWRN